MPPQHQKVNLILCILVIEKVFIFPSFSPHLPTLSSSPLPKTHQLSIMEGKWGLIPDMSISVTLAELVRADHARELTYTGRVIGAAEARDVGLVTTVTEEGEVFFLFFYFSFVLFFVLFFVFTFFPVFFFCSADCRSKSPQVSP